MNPYLIYEVNSLQYRAGIQMAKLATEADEFEEIQLAIHSLEFARELSGGIGKRNEQLLLDLNQKLKTLSDYNTRILIEQKSSKLDKRFHRYRHYWENLMIKSSVVMVQILKNNYGYILLIKNLFSFLFIIINFLRLKNYNL